ncbi:MAG TPA: peptide deformylase [Candidatus Paceibacterota bacterium]|nr:peptide deformylase [Candidatus Paceibacterota bacterium]
MIKETIQIGNPNIRKKSKKVSKTDISSKKIKTVISDLVDSMRHNELVGISAPQINKNIKIFATEIRQTKNRKPADMDELRVFINPEINFFSKETYNDYEGCGSVANANLFGLVKRSKSVIIKALDLNGKVFELKATGLLARVIQHEYDHLDGILFTDRVTDTKSYMSGSEYRKMMSK